MMLNLLPPDSFPKLPTEIHLEIFDLCKSTITFHKPPSPTSFPWNISRVSSKWRQLALNHARLWSDITVSSTTSGFFARSVNPPSEAELELVKARLACCLKRARPVPLSLRLFFAFDCNRDIFSSVIEEISKAGNSILELELVLSAYVNPKIIGPLTDQFHRIETLKIHMHPRPGVRGEWEVTPAPFEEFPALPYLKELYIEDGACFAENFRINPGQLHSYKGPLSPFVLRQASSLKECAFGWGAILSLQAPVVLPHVDHLILPSGFTMSWKNPKTKDAIDNFMSFPSLRSLTLGCLGGITDIDTFLVNHGHSIRELHLSFYHPWGRFGPLRNHNDVFILTLIAERTPNLELLELTDAYRWLEHLEDSFLEPSDWEQSMKNWDFLGTCVLSGLDKADQEGEWMIPKLFTILTETPPFVSVVINQAASKSAGNKHIELSEYLGQYTTT